LSARVYVLLDVVHGKSAEVVRALQGKPGVIMADIIEGPPDVVMVIEARGRRRLAELTVEILTSIEHMTGDLKVLPVSANGRGYVSIRTARAYKVRNRMTSRLPNKKDVGKARK